MISFRSSWTQQTFKHKAKAFTNIYFTSFIWPSWKQYGVNLILISKWSKRLPPTVHYGSLRWYNAHDLDQPNSSLLFKKHDMEELSKTSLFIRPPFIPFFFPENGTLVFRIKTTTNNLRSRELSPYNTKLYWKWMGKGIFYFSLKKNLRAISSSPLFTLFTLKGVTKSIFPQLFMSVMIFMLFFLPWKRTNMDARKLQHMNTFWFWCIPPLHLAKHFSWFWFLSTSL